MSEPALTFISRTAPKTHPALRQALYDGTVFHFPKSAATTRIATQATALLSAELAPGPIREAQFRLTNEEFFQRIGRIRKILFTARPFHQAVREVLCDHGFDPGENAFDPLRLRVVTHRGFEIESAAPVYYAHRDTWYGHPQCQITWWIALHDASDEETFEFYPDYFDQPVPNNSETFCYDEWVKNGWGLKIGWQNINAGKTARYPGQTAEVELRRRESFSCAAGDLLLFAGSHFHQTRKNLTGRTRFSLDFRTAHLPDYRSGIGAPGVDNRSRGSAVPDYVQP